VDDIDVEDVRALLTADDFWKERNVTASRVRGRIENVLDYAAALKKRTGDNPASWALLKSLLPKPSKIAKVQHHEAMDWREVPAFMAELMEKDEVARRALAFAILTATRSGEVRGMTWGEVSVRWHLDNPSKPHEGRARA
jgi:integrase